MFLTTVDNPWNPFTEFADWYTWDIKYKHYTLNKLATIAENLANEELSESSQDDAMTAAMDDLLKRDKIGLYRAVYEFS